MMKKESWLTRIAITLITILLLTGCTSRSIVEGSEATYYGIVTDRAMSSNQYDRYGRPYISILIDSDEGMLFWCADEDPTPDGLQIGDRVKIESAIELETNYLIATNIEIIN